MAITDTNKARTERIGDPVRSTQTSRGPSGPAQAFQRSQGASTSSGNTGGAVGNNNVAGNTGAFTGSTPEQLARRAAMADKIAATTKPVPPTFINDTTNKNTLGKVAGALKIPSTYTNAIRSVNSYLPAMSVAHSLMTDPKLVTQRDDALRRATSKFSGEGGFLGIGGKNIPEQSSDTNTNLSEQFKAVGNAQLNSTPFRSTFTDVVDKANYTPESSAFNVDPNNYGVSQGKGGNTMYTKNQDGSIARVDLNTGSRKTLGDNLSHSVDRPLRPEEQAAVDRSNKMIQDWKDYKERKPLQDFLKNNLGNPRASAHQLQIVESRLNALDKNKVDREQIGATLQANENTVFQRQQEADQTARAKIGDQSIDYAKAREDATSNTFNWLTDLKKNSTTDPSSIISLAKARGQLSPDIVHFAYGDAFKGITNKEEYMEKASDLGIPDDVALIGSKIYN